MSLQKAVGKPIPLFRTWARAITVGARVPSVKLKAVKGSEVSEVTTDEFFKGKTVLVSQSSIWSMKDPVRITLDP